MNRSEHRNPQSQVINLIGGLTNETELCSAESGAVSRLLIAVERRRSKDRQGCDADFIDVRAFENFREEPWLTIIG